MKKEIYRREKQMRDISGAENKLHTKRQNDAIIRQVVMMIRAASFRNII